MSETPYAFFRGSLPLFAHDFWHGDLRESRFALESPLVWSLGDAHVENFGTLRARDGVLVLEPNDFDAADRAPYLWDVRRLVASVAVAASLANEDDPAARQTSHAARLEIAAAAAGAYAEAIIALAGGEAAQPAVGGSSGSVVLADLFDRAANDAKDREELDELTELDGTTRRLKRGVLAAGEVGELVDLDPLIARAIPELLARARATLVAPPPHEFFRAVDMARLYGAGVASLPRLRWLVLLRGPSDEPADDVIVQIKEVAESGTASPLPPAGRFSSIAARILETSRRAWSEPDADPLWGVAEAFGLTFQVRTEAESHKTIRVARLEGKLGTVDALRDLARVLGALLARVHAASTPEERTPAARIRDRLGGDLDGFVAEQATSAVRFADRVSEDMSILRRIRDRRGPLLGANAVPVAEAISPDLRRLFGDRPDLQ